MKERSGEKIKSVCVGPNEKEATQLEETKQRNRNAVSKASNECYSASHKGGMLSYDSFVIAQWWRES